MPDTGRGNAHHAATPKEAPGIFAREFEGLMSLVAQNVSVEIRLSEEVKGPRHPERAPQVPAPGGVQVQLGDAYGDQRRRVLFELHTTGLASLGLAKGVEVVLRYVSAGDRRPRAHHPPHRDPEGRPAREEAAVPV